jgi:hypothetical protein
LKNEYPEVYEELQSYVPAGIEGNDFYNEMLRLLKVNYRNIWKEL